MAQAALDAMVARAVSMAGYPPSVKTAYSKVLTKAGITTPTMLFQLVLASPAVSPQSGLLYLLQQNGAPPSGPTLTQWVVVSGNLTNISLGTAGNKPSTAQDTFAPRPAPPPAPAARAQAQQWRSQQGLTADDYWPFP